MASLTTQLRVPSIPIVSSPSLSGSSEKKRARISCSLSSGFSRKDAGEQLYYIGTLRSFSQRCRRQRDWVLQASGENEAVNIEDKPVAGDSEATKNVDQNSSGPPVLTILAGLLVLAGCLWVLGSLLLWFIGLFLSYPWTAHNLSHDGDGDPLG